MSKELKDLLQKVLAGVLIVTGITLILLSHFLAIEALLGIGIPVLVAGIGVVANIFDPRQRYVFNLNSISYDQNGARVITRRSSPRDAIISMRSTLNSLGYRVTRRGATPPGSETEAAGNSEAGPESSGPGPVQFSPQRGDSEFTTAYSHPPSSEGEPDEVELSDSIYQDWVYDDDEESPDMRRPIWFYV